MDEKIIAVKATALSLLPFDADHRFDPRHLSGKVSVVCRIRYGGHVFVCLRGFLRHTPVGSAPDQNTPFCQMINHLLAAPPPEGLVPAQATTRPMASRSKRSNHILRGARQYIGSRSHRPADQDRLSG